MYLYIYIHPCANLDLESAAVFKNSQTLNERSLCSWFLGSTLNVSFWLFETTSANVNLKPLKVIVNHIVDESLQDFQAWAEDVKSVGKPIFACWPG